MDHCRHVNKLCVGQTHSILDPSEWHCSVCGTTESVWACLSCTNVACGRYNEEHALKHFKDTNHPLAIEVNEKYVYCYECDDYILNDNVTGDIKFLRDTLEVITKQTLEENSERRQRTSRFLRSLSVDSSTLKHSHGREDLFVMKDKGHTALIHRRFMLLSKTFLGWKHLVHGDKETGLKTPTKTVAPVAQKKRNEDDEITFKDPSQVKLETGTPPAHPKVAKRVQKVVTPIKRKWTVLTPGVTGLRNLGNTCYMNSILQVLSHLLRFRDCFLKVEIDLRPQVKSEGKSQSQPVESRKRTHEYMRQTTVECFKLSQTPRNDEPSSSRVQRQQRQRGPGGGLNGGSDDTKEAVDPSKCKDPRKVNNNYPLCHELHMLFRVMWSGKWAIVSPHGILSSVWRLIPSFRGYSQQDAQEFLCEFMDKIHSELQTLSAPVNLLPGGGAPIVKTMEIVPKLFEGWLVSQVMCLKCKSKSNTYEPFWDLSLEFPERYQFSMNRTNISEDTCPLIEMLSKFTEIEHLDGPVYQCEACNSKRREASGKPVIRTEATKRLLVTKLPHILRLHLKRFRWSGRNHREKIHAPVTFDEELNMRQFCLVDPSNKRVLTSEDYMYDLTAAVIHHGRGFGSGHYTAYSWNHEGGFWVHCNDARLELCSIEDVTACQAYILFYTKRTNVATATTPGKEDEEEPEVPNAHRVKRRRITL